MSGTKKKDSLSKEELGFAGRLADSFIHSPLSPLLFVAMMLVGIYGLYATPRQEDPQISVPMIDIMLQMPGASSQEISRLVVSPLERLVSEIHGVKHVYSVSDEGMGIITLEFHVGEEIAQHGGEVPMCEQVYQQVIVRHRIAETWFKVLHVSEDYPQNHPLQAQPLGMRLFVATRQKCPRPGQRKHALDDPEVAVITQEIRAFFGVPHPRFEHSPKHGCM